MARFRREEANLFTFYQVPKELFTNSKYTKFSAESKILYGLLLDRNSLSQANEWVDEEGYVYIYFSREEAAKLLGVGKNNITRLFAELREAELIEEVKQGLNKPNIIYVHRFIPSQNVWESSENQHESMDSPKQGVQNPQNRESRIPKTGSPESPKQGANNTEINNTEKVILSQSVSQSDPETDGQTDELNLIYQKTQITLFQDESLQELLKDVIKALYIENPSKVAKLNLAHIDRALAKFRTAQEEKPIKNPKKYFQQCLLSAIDELPLQNLGYEKPEQTEDSRTGKEKWKMPTTQEWQKFKAKFHNWSQEVTGKMTGTV